MVVSAFQISEEYVWWFIYSATLTRQFTARYLPFRSAIGGVQTCGLVLLGRCLVMPGATR